MFLPLLDLRMPLRFLRGNYTRLALAVVALGCGVALVCAIDLVNRAVLAAFVEVVDTMAGRAALQVTSGEGGLIPEELVTKVARVQGVELAVAVLNATTFTGDGSGDLLTVRGVDLAHEAAVRAYRGRGGSEEVQDSLVFLSQSDSIALTRVFAARKNLELGDAIDLVTPGGIRRFTVRGLLDPEGIARVYGGSLVVMDIAAAELAFGQAGFCNAIDVVVERSAEVSAVRDAIAAILPPEMQVQAPSQRKADIHRIMRSLEVALRAVGLMGLVAAFLIAFNRLAAGFERRAWQVGVLRAVGMRQGRVLGELVKEGLFVGTLGVLLGIPLGIALARVLLPVITTSASLGYKLVAPTADLSVRPVSVALASVLGLTAAGLASALPAWRAARMEVVESLRGRNVEQPSLGRRWMVLTRMLVLAGAALSIALQATTQKPVWGLLATGLLAAGTALVARPLVSLVGGGLTRFLGRHSGPAVRFAMASLLRNPRRTSLSVATLGVGLGSVLWLSIVSSSFERSVMDTVSGVVRARIVLRSAHLSAGTITAPLDDGLLRELWEVPGTTALVGLRKVDWHYRGGPIAINAMDASYFVDPAFGEWPLFGERQADVWERVSRGEAIIVSTNMAMNLGLRVGDVVDLETPIGPLRLPIAGITVDFHSPRGTIEMERGVYRRFWRDNDLTEVYVQTEPPREGDVRRAVAERLGGKYQLEVLSAAGLSEYFGEQVRRAFAPVRVLTGMFFVVVLLGMTDTLGASVVERTRELGAIRAVGGRRMHVRRIVLIEGLLLGLLGVVLGCVSGWMLGVLWVDSTFPYLLGWVLELHVPLYEIGLAVLAAVVVCVAAAVVPAAQAARLQPVVALRYE